MRMASLLLLVSLLAVVPAAAAGEDWPGRPQSPAPHLAQQGPPPAWVETRTKASWMAYGSYCWSAPAAGRTRKVVCADMVAPQSRTDLRAIVVPQRGLVRIHLGFLPRSAHLTLFRGGSFKHDVLAPRRVMSWSAPAGGIASLDLAAPAGAAAYLIKVRVR
jgi:hypothetical protein